MRKRCPDEVEADLARFYGVHDERAHTLTHIATLVTVMIRDPDSWTHRAINEHWQWANPTVALEASMVDYLALLVWQQTKDGQKNRNRPKPVPRPGDKPAKSERDEYAPVTLDAFDEALKRAQTH